MTNDHAGSRMNMRRPNILNSAEPVDARHAGRSPICAVAGLPEPDTAAVHDWPGLRWSARTSDHVRSLVLRLLVRSGGGAVAIDRDY